MKKEFKLTVVLILMSVVLFAQEKNEVKLNFSNLVGFTALDIGFEHLINNESAIGIDALFALDGTVKILKERRTFSLTPYYRHFFSNEFAEGFFGEVFTMIHSGEIKGTTEDYTDLAIGLSGGYKYVSDKGFVAEAYFGIGRDFLDKSQLDIVTRGGLSVGYRF